MKKLLTMLAAFFVVIGVAQATIQTNFVGGTTGYPNSRSGKTFVFENTLDFAVTDLGTNDVIRCFQIPSNTMVLGVSWRVDTAVTNLSFSFDIGDLATTNGWANNVFPTNTTAAYVSGFSSPTITSAITRQIQTITNVVYDSGATTGNVVIVTNATAAITVAPTYGTGKLYVTNDFISVQVDGQDPGPTGKIQLRVIGVDLN